jgi:hypothetical protein
MRLGRHTPSGCGNVRSHRIIQCHVAQLLSCLFFQQNKALAAPHTGHCGSAVSRQVALKTRLVKRTPCEQASAAPPAGRLTCQAQPHEVPQLHYVIAVGLGWSSPKQLQWLPSHNTVQARTLQGPFVALSSPS